MVQDFFHQQYKQETIWSQWISTETTETTEKIEGCDVKHVLCFNAPGDGVRLIATSNLYCYSDFASIAGSLNSGQPLVFWDARIDLGKIYNATDIEIYFGWRAQVRIDSIDSTNCRLSAKFRSWE